MLVVGLLCADGVSEIAMDPCYSHQPLLFLLIRGGGSEGASSSSTSRTR